MKNDPLAVAEMILAGTEEDLLADEGLDQMSVQSVIVPDIGLKTVQTIVVLHAGTLGQEADRTTVVREGQGLVPPRKFAAAKPNYFCLVPAACQTERQIAVVFPVLFLLYTRSLSYLLLVHVVVNPSQISIKFTGSLLTVAFNRWKFVLQLGTKVNLCQNMMVIDIKLLF